LGELPDYRVDPGSRGDRCHEVYSSTTSARKKKIRPVNYLHAVELRFDHL
jgi:hypothetical protein